MLCAYAAAKYDGAAAAAVHMLAALSSEVECWVLLTVEFRLPMCQLQKFKYGLWQPFAFAHVPPSVAAYASPIYSCWQQSFVSIPPLRQLKY